MKPKALPVRNNYQQLQLKRINLGKDWKLSPKQQNKQSELVSRRLKHYLNHKKKSIDKNRGVHILENQQQNASLKFHDAEYFRQGKIAGTSLAMNNNIGENIGNYSNLLIDKVITPQPKRHHKSVDSSKKYLFIKHDDTVDDEQTSKYINFQMQVPKASVFSSIKSFIKSPKRERSNSKSSVCQKKRQSISRSGGYKIKVKSQVDSSLQRGINPYTKQKYLYVKKKNKQQIKEAINKLKDRQTMQNILKPCQIVQKQLSQRKKTVDKGRGETLTKMKYSLSTGNYKKCREMPLNIKEEYHTIEPWHTEKGHHFHQQAKQFFI